MKDEIKEILDYFKRSNKNKLGFEQDKIITYKEANQLSDYITNLQEELEEEERIEQADFKTIQNLEEENERLKELCDKYEEEHSTTFNEWKETITDKYQTLKDLQEENERLKKELNALRISEEEWLNETLGGDEEC